LLAWESALRFLWNLALEQRKLGLARPRRLYPDAFDQISELKALCAEVPFLADVPRNVCAQLLVQLDRAWQRCFKRLARAPRWKRKSRDSLSLTEPHPKVWRLVGSTLRFPKLGTLSAAYAKSHGTVVVERLQTANMLRNRPLARRIADAGWSRLVELLRYKLAFSGGRLVEVPAAYSSRFCCRHCGYIDHADLNAAKVLKTRVNRSALPVEGARPEGTRRSRPVEAGKW
jgi:IS605 OrfB family transposase